MDFRISYMIENSYTTVKSKILDYFIYRNNYVGYFVLIIDLMFNTVAEVILDD